MCALIIITIQDGGPVDGAHHGVQVQVQAEPGLPEDPAGADTGAAQLVAHMMLEGAQHAIKGLNAMNAQDN